jgi:hypothetical protein
MLDRPHAFQRDYGSILSEQFIRINLLPGDVHPEIPVPNA